LLLQRLDVTCTCTENAVTEVSFRFS